MTSFSRFQERNKKRVVAQQNLNTSFIFKGYPSIKISHGDLELQASVVNKQEQDYAYVYTQLKDNLEIGSVWTAKNLHLLITEEITIIKDVNWHKYHALLCNVEVAGFWGFFLGPEKSYINVKLENKALIESQQKPILVLPANVLSFEDKIMIGGRAWLVQEYDTISTPGLVYYSLRPTTMSKEVVESNAGKQVFVEKAAQKDVDYQEEPFVNNGIYTIAANQQIELTTEQGFFNTSNSNIKIVKRTTSKIIFSIPFGIEEVTIQIMKKGDIVERTYRVV